MDILLNKKIQQHLFILEKYYLSEYRKDISFNTLGLFSGLAGIILLQALFLRSTKNQKFKSEIDKNIDILIEKIEDENYSLYTYADGLAGIGWLFVYLIECKIVELDGDAFLEELDEVLEIELGKMIEDKNFDILHGAIGLGLYFLKRDKIEILERLITAVNENSEALGTEIMWRRFDVYYYKKDIYDFGLAHGNAGILYFLGKCYQKNILPAISLRLIKGGINFYKANIQDTENYHSIFPNAVVTEEYKQINTQAHSRFAWCYGDLGILHSLILISRWIKDKIDEEIFQSLLESSMFRKTISETGSEDACFCHGSSGIAWLYFNIYRITNNGKFSETSNYWLHRTLELATEKNGSLDYTFVENGETIKEKTPENLLTGMGGVTLTLLNYVYGNGDTANELFFLS